MTQEVNEGTAYLMALKESSGRAGAPTAAGTAATQELSPMGNTAFHSAACDVGDRFQGAEKRRTPRYKCEGSAEVRVDGCDLRTWATFTDVSLHGGYVEAQATDPTGTVLHLKLEVNGIRVETKGTVKVTYPYLAMGIALMETSDENQVQSQRLVQNLSCPGMVMGRGLRLRYRLPNRPMTSR